MQESPKLARFDNRRCRDVRNYRNGWKQYKVSEGDVIKVEKLDAEVGAKVTFDNVLLVGGDTVKVGTPTVDGAKVEASVVSEEKVRKSSFTNTRENWIP